jgi:Acyl-CoA carboxylase epsilon subunit
VSPPTEPDRGAGPDATEPAPVPLWRVTCGNPSAEEVAALVAVLTARSAPTGPGAPAVSRSEWGAHARRLRGIHRHHPGAWRASAWPG